MWLVHMWAISHSWAAVGDWLQVVHLATTGFWPGYLMLSSTHSDPVVDPRAGVMLASGEHTCNSCPPVRGTT